MARQKVDSPQSIKTKKFGKKLPVRIGPEEYEKTAEKLAVKIAEVDKLEASKKEAAKDFTDRIMIAAREQEALRKIVETHTKEEMVPCEETPDFTKNRVVTIRLDTQEQIEERAMDSGERAKWGQGDLVPESSSANGSGGEAQPSA